MSGEPSGPSLELVTPKTPVAVSGIPEANRVATIGSKALENAQKVKNLKGAATEHDYTNAILELDNAQKQIQKLYPSLELTKKGKDDADSKKDNNLEEREKQYFKSPNTEWKETDVIKVFFEQLLNMILKMLKVMEVMKKAHHNAGVSKHNKMVRGLNHTNSLANTLEQKTKNLETLLSKTAGTPTSSPNNKPSQ